MGNGKNGRRKQPPFVMLQRPMLRSKQYAELSFKARALLIELLNQYNGSNNGDLSAPYSTMKHRGFKSKGTLENAIKELLATGFIKQTRQGGRNKCSLYASSFYPIDECKGKLDVMPTTKATNDWH